MCTLQVLYFLPGGSPNCALSRAPDGAESLANELPKEKCAPRQDAERQRPDMTGVVVIDFPHEKLLGDVVRLPTRWASRQGR